MNSNFLKYGTAGSAGVGSLISAASAFLPSAFAKPIVPEATTLRPQVVSETVNNFFKAIRKLDNVNSFTFRTDVIRDTEYGDNTETLSFKIKNGEVTPVGNSGAYYANEGLNAAKFFHEQMKRVHGANSSAIQEYTANVTVNTFGVSYIEDGVDSVEEDKGRRAIEACNILKDGGILNVRSLGGEGGGYEFFVNGYFPQEGRHPIASMAATCGRRGTAEPYSATVVTPVSIEEDGVKKQVNFVHVIANRVKDSNTPAGKSDRFEHCLTRLIRQDGNSPFTFANPMTADDQSCLPRAMYFKIPALKDGKEGSTKAHLAVSKNSGGLALHCCWFENNDINNMQCSETINPSISKYLEKAGALKNLVENNDARTLKRILENIEKSNPERGAGYVEPENSIRSKISDMVNEKINTELKEKHKLDIQVENNGTPRIPPFLTTPAATTATKPAREAKPTQETQAKTKAPRKAPRTTLSKEQRLQKLDALMVGR